MTREHASTDPVAPATLSVEQAAEYLGVSRATAWRRVWDGSIPSIKLGGRVLVSRARLDALLNGDDGEETGTGSAA